LAKKILADEESQSDLNIAVNNAIAMKVLQCKENLLHHAFDVVQWEGSPQPKKPSYAATLCNEQTLKTF
jgi:hypothetical protein